MPSNFDFLRSQHPDLHRSASEAEALVHRAPRAACFTARFALEQAVHWLYSTDPALSLPYDHKLGALIHEPSFKDNLPRPLFSKVRTVLKVGNQSAHDPRPLGPRDAVHVVRELFHFLYWVSRVYALDPSKQPKVQWDPGLLPVPEEAKKETLEQMAKLEARLADSDAMAQIAEERRARTEAEMERLKKEIAALKKQNEAVPDDHDYDEETTRERFIDILLKEAGWDPDAPDAVEYEVFGMPKGRRSPNGRGLVDYVLWGDDGLPLALVEAKRTRKSAKKGQRQAELYADCLEAKFGRRPIIFCSNGYEHWMWDDRAAGGLSRYAIREVAGFYTKAELELLHHRRGHAKGLHLVQVNDDIVNRSYQHEAIRRITETFGKWGRKNLLVMATGTGKTRTAIALVDLMKRADWVKRVLFLADRNALLVQAKRAFMAHLPTATVADITQDKEGVDATVVLSTYPTMLNRIDTREDGQHVFGPGHFDLVIVDEAHRSIYKKYALLFEYFDALLVGLTATPRSEVHRDTYRIFDLEPGVPTYAYELDDAVKDGYLVPPVGIKAPFKFLQKGVKYSELSDEEKEHYEERLSPRYEDEALPEHVNAAALNKWLFNIPTVDGALELLMEHGLKVEDGDRLGKTIVFARNQTHAEFIEERFNVHYPHYGGVFARVIHSQVDYVQTLIDDFSTADKQPSIALSVDMLDTGIDVPEVLNLVFFKPVRSRVKFNQMLGRGTRLCIDLFGPGSHKTEFLVFDMCGNFEFFEQDVDDKDPKLPETLTSRLFRTQLGVVLALGHPGGGDEQETTQDKGAAELKVSLLDALHAHVAELHPDNFLVRRHRRAVEEFSDRERWDKLTPEDPERINTELAALPNLRYLDTTLEAKQFDLLCYRLMLSTLQGAKSFPLFRDKVRDLAGKLEEVETIPMVKAKIVLIQEVQPEEYWADITAPMIDRVRRELRDLIQFIDKRSRPNVFTDLPDPLVAEDVVNVPTAQTGFSQHQYRKKVEAIVSANEDHVAVAKLRRNQPLTPTDLSALEAMLFDPTEVGTQEQFEQAYGKGVALPLFIRRLVGLDRSAAKEAFSEYLAGTPLGASQISFINTLIEYLTKNGVMDPGMLYEPPFTDLHYEGLDGVFGEADAENIVSIVRGFNETVGAFVEGVG